jgi:chitinase
MPVLTLSSVNFAFASIDPSTYQVVAMDSATPTSLFSDVTNLKSVKEDIKVYVSIGGWTFSDNGTDTQPVFGDIAASASNRKKFANNVVHFMRQYGIFTYLFVCLNLIFDRV